MVKCLSKKILIVALSLLLAAIFSVSAFAEVPYESYTYWSDVGDENKAVYNRPMYSAEYTAWKSGTMAPTHWLSTSVMMWMT